MMQKLPQREVLQFDLDGVFISRFRSLAEASRSVGVDRACIGDAARGKLRKAGNWVWKYATEAKDTDVIPFPPRKQKGKHHVR